MQRVAQGSDKLAMQIELGVVQSATLTLLPTVRAVLQDSYPELKCRFVSGLSEELLSRVMNGTISAAIITQPKSIDRQVRCQTLLEERLVIICHKKHGKPSIRQLEKLPFIRFNRQHGVGRIVEAELHRQGIRVHDAMESDTLDGILAMVSSGFGIAIVPEHSVLSHYRRLLHVTPFGRPVATRRLALVMSRRPELMAVEDALLAGLSVAVKQLKKQ
jgi:DNA-binding transcriptional LysR family regulator